MIIKGGLKLNELTKLREYLYELYSLNLDSSFILNSLKDNLFKLPILNGTDKINLINIFINTDSFLKKGNSEILHIENLIYEIIRYIHQNK
jgi:hypothetical protein